MVEYQYTTVTGKLEDLLTKLREVRVPDKATNKWLASIGFTSSNDRSLLRVLRFIGFLDDSGKPDQIWTTYRSRNHRRVLAEAIREGYSELFGIYPDAHLRSSQELDSFFRTRSAAGAHVISRTVATFKTLCELADFETAPSVVTEPEATRSEDGASRREEQVPENVGRAAMHSAPAIHIDIQVHISPDASADQIDQIFASMAKHIYRS